MKSFFTHLLIVSSSLLTAEAADLVKISSLDGLHSQQPERVALAISQVDKQWQDSYTPMVIEALRFSRDVNNQRALINLLHKRTKLARSSDLSAYWHWVWNKSLTPHPKYSEFKTNIYKKIDPSFAEYFDNNPKNIIRLDEIRWGGVLRDGIPPLKDPKVLRASQAGFMSDKDVVFGVSFNGTARAYPKRILAWHEMVKDKVGGKSINGVYCTLCGSMIVYDTEFKGKHYELGTSGFLYRSNKLMYDHRTKSMWSTIEGKPVLGPLVNKGIQLKPLTVVTTTWGEWKKRHPQTTVLSLQTGHHRDYGEGVAYKKYFATDRLMFEIPKKYKDTRLKNKTSILALRLGSGAKDKVAFSPKFLKKNPVYNYTHKDTSIVILTDKSGASRVYETNGHAFKNWDQNFTIQDNDGAKWTLTEQKLTNSSGKSFPRYASHSAFWFGWRSAYPETTLVK